MALEPALHSLLLVLDGVPGEEDEEEAEELEAGGQAKVDEAQGGDVVLPAGAVDAAVLLPQHAGGVDDGAEVNGRRDVGESPEENKLHSQSEWPLLLRYRPERDDDGGGLGAGSDERDDEEEDEEGDEGAAGAVALPRYSVAILIQVGLDNDELQLVAALTAGRRRDDLPALDAGAIRVVTDPGAVVGHTAAAG